MHRVCIYKILVWYKCKLLQYLNLIVSSKFGFKTILPTSKITTISGCSNGKIPVGESSNGDLGDVDDGTGSPGSSAELQFGFKYGGVALIRGTVFSLFPLFIIKFSKKFGFSFVDAGL